MRNHQLPEFRELRQDRILPGWVDVWTDEQRAEADRLLEGFDLRIERRGEAIFEAGTLRPGCSPSAEMTVLVATHGSGDTVTLVAPETFSDLDPLMKTGRMCLRTRRGESWGVVTDIHGGRRSDDVHGERWYLTYQPLKG